MNKKPTTHINRATLVYIILKKTADLGPISLSRKLNSVKMSALHLNKFAAEHVKQWHQHITLQHDHHSPPALPIITPIVFKFVSKKPAGPKHHETHHINEKVHELFPFDLSNRYIG